MVRAAPVVPPVNQYPHCVEEPAIEVLEIVIENVAPAAMEGVVIVTCPTRPFRVAVVVPDTVVDVNWNPLPAVEETKFPFVAVMFPSVAVRLVEAVRDPVTAVFPVAFPIFTAPVPPVPIVVTADPEVLMFVVPVMAAPPADTVSPPVVATRPAEAVKDPVTAVFPVAFPIFTAPVPPVPMVVTPEPEVLIVVVPVMAKPPAVTVRPPDVTVRPVPAVIVVVEAIEPGAINVEGIERVATPAEVETVIWLVVPRIELRPLSEDAYQVPAPVVKYT